MELIFLISTFVPNLSLPFSLIETLTSHLKEPSSIFPSLTPEKTTIERILSTYFIASSPERISGFETISISGVPARL